jgi:hypothetical protein
MLRRSCYQLSGVCGLSCIVKTGMLVRRATYESSYVPAAPDKLGLLQSAQEQALPH